MNHKELLIKAITTLNKFKQAGIEPVEFWGDVNTNIHVKLQFNKTKCGISREVLHFNNNWFNWDYKFDKSIVNIEKAKIPEYLPDEQKVILRLAFAIWEIMIANEYI